MAEVGGNRQAGAGGTVWTLDLLPGHKKLCKNPLDKSRLVNIIKEAQQKGNASKV